jgi:4-nitrophenyl phosphatase
VIGENDKALAVRIHAEAHDRVRFAKFRVFLLEGNGGLVTVMSVGDHEGARAQALMQHLDLGRRIDDPEPVEYVFASDNASCGGSVLQCIQVRTQTPSTPIDSVDRGEVDRARSHKSESIFLRPSHGSFVGQDAGCRAEGFENESSDHAGYPAPPALAVHKVLPVDVEGGNGIGLQNSLRQPAIEGSGDTAVATAWILLGQLEMDGIVRAEFVEPALFTFGYDVERRADEICQGRCGRVTDASERSQVGHGRRMISAQIDGLVCDMDGVLYRGSETIPGAPEAIARLRDNGVRILFCTNNSNLTVAQYCEKLADMGIVANPSDILTSAVVTCEVLRERGFAGKRALVVGGRGLEDAASDAELQTWTDPGSEQVDVVLIGWDPHFDYRKMTRAATAVRNGAHFIASNADATFPAPEGPLPGAGALVASIEVASGRRAEVLGKPHKPMTDAIVRRLGSEGRLGAVGDRPDTDLAVAFQMGWMAILVLSGVTSAAQAAALQRAPDLVVDSIAELG